MMWGRVSTQLVSVAMLFGPFAVSGAWGQQAEPASEAGEVSMQVLYDDIRMPKIVVAPDDTVLAFAGGCRLLRRSMDAGETWSAPETVNPDGSGNAIVDETTGDVLIVCPLVQRLYRSSDSGRTWRREDISFRPNKIGHGTAETVPVDVTASESGITLRHGAHQGRLLMPARVQLQRGKQFAEDRQEYWQYHYNASILSDDGGRSWQVGEPVQSGTGEGTLAELSDGRIYYNSRCHMAADHRRRIAWSYDGGYRWVDWQVSDELFEVGGPHYFKYGRKPSYGCNAGLVRVPLEATAGEDVLLYCAPDNPGATTPHNGRIKMTVWMSRDGAETWPIKKLVHEGISVYSSITANTRGHVFVLFESGREKLYETIVVARLRLDSF